MSAANVLFLLLRSAHVLLAAVWVGSTALAAFLLLPALGDAGESAAPVMSALTRRKLNAFFASSAGLTVLTGIYLYWRLTGGFDPAMSATRGAMVFGTGGVAGIIALILGGAIVGRNLKKMDTATGTALVDARRKTITFAKIVFVLQLIALVAMAVGHYV
jgi:uncharacterized membrane protein